MVSTVGTGGGLSGVKPCAWCGTQVDVRNARGVCGRARDPVVFPACDHALHPSCLLAWQYSESTPKQRELLERRRATKYRKDLRGLALAEYDSRYGGACQGCAASGALS